MRSKLRIIVWMFFVVGLMSCEREPVQKHYLFTYFKGNGGDGLHLAHSTDGRSWEELKSEKSFLSPEVGKDRLMRDPCIIKGEDDVYHMVWTVSWGEKGIGYASTKDFINWSEQKYIPVMEKEEEALNCWAPEITYNSESKEYLIYWATTIPGRFPETDGVGDGKYNHRIYSVKTKDFESFSPAKLFYDQGFNVIDASIQKRDDKYIMFLKDETKHPVEKNLRIASSKFWDKQYSKPSEPITGDYWCEGPTAIQINKTWFVYFDKYRERKMGAVVSDDFIHWKDISEEIHFPKGTRHGTVIEVSEEIVNRLKER